MKTIKLTIEGEPAYVEAIAHILRECLDIREEGKNQRLQLRPGEIRRVLRVAVPDIITIEEETCDQPTEN